MKVDAEIEKMTTDEIKAEYALVAARLEEIEHVIDPALIDEIADLREYATVLKCTVLARLP